MSHAYPTGCTGNTIGAESGRSTALGAAEGLHLAATPTFAMMALLTGILGGDQSDMLCTAAHDGWTVGGMVPMYVLMSAFHLTPWLKLVARRTH